MTKKHKEAETVYSWAHGSRIKLDPEVIGSEIESIRTKRPGGDLPRQLVKAAKVKRSPLHRYFEWDDDIAAGRWRLEQATHLIICLNVIMPEKPEAEPTRALVSMGKGNYESIGDVLIDPLNRERLLSRARAEMESFKRRYATLTELSAVFDAMEQLDVA